MPTECPDHPWQRVGTDLLELRGKTYLLAVDYFSRFIEIALLNKTKSKDVIQLKSFFCPSWHSRVPNVRQWATVFQTGFRRLCCSLWIETHHKQTTVYAKRSGACCTHRAVHTVRNLLKKAADPYLALLAYKATPLQNGYSSAELLLGRRLRTTLPILLSQLDPSIVQNLCATCHHVNTCG